MKPNRTATPPGGSREGHEGLGIAVGPGLARPALHGGLGGYRLNPLEIQPAKIHCPPPREDWLSRERLNTWLERASAGRLGLIVAEAGFGKTTLLADWAIHTSRLTSWYRLESDDRDWLTFIRHLVAGGRELDPEFAPETFRLLHSLGPGGPTSGDLTASIAREMATFGAASETGLTLLVDDYHVVDGHPDTDPIMRALLDRTGPGFSIVIATRSMPRFSVGRLRARGGVMTIDGETLCFDMDETSRLFRDAYHRPLEEDIVTDLHDRTEGWPALLTLVRTGLDDRESADPRALVAHMDASRGDLYEFLAEEVMGSMPAELQHFLTRVSVLMAVDVESAMLVDDRPAEAIAASIRESERLGLLSRPDRESPHRFHHLVREFLASRLESEIGEAEVRALHRSIADRLREKDWYAAAWHYLMAGDPDNCSAVVDAALDEIIATGMFDQVRPFLDKEGGDPNRAPVGILRSRLELSRGDTEMARRLAMDAVMASLDSSTRGSALLNLSATLVMTGLRGEAEVAAHAALAEELSATQRRVAEGTVSMLTSDSEGDLRRISETLASIADAQERDGQMRFMGVSRLNLAGMLIWLGDFERALREATRAEIALGGLGNPSVERVAATIARANALAHAGNLEQARVILRDARGDASAVTVTEWATETARIEAEFGSVEAASRAVAQVDPEQAATGYSGLRSLARGEIAMRVGDLGEAALLSRELLAKPLTDTAGKLRAHLFRARVALALRSSDAATTAAEARRIAEAQQSSTGGYLAQLLYDMATGTSLEVSIGAAPASRRFAWSLLAEEVSSRLAALSGPALDRVRTEAELRPERWRTALRLAVDAGVVDAGSLLADIGSSDDAAFLRIAATSRRPLRPHAQRITRRLADRVQVNDLGPVEIQVGHRIPARSVRRKVLALACLLSSRPHMAANREEVLDALWPELSPDAASNSLHQAIYHWRRLLEPDYREWATANYVSFDGEVVSFDPGLVDSSSRMVWRMLRTSDGGSRVDEIVDIYRGRYAIDFAYDDWTNDYRESLHSAVLAAVEAEIRRRRTKGEYDSAIGLSHRILAVDPQADAIEAELVRTYKDGGRQAAAAEQYAHYSTFVRDELGGEPVPLDDL